MIYHDCFLRMQGFCNCGKIFHYISALKEENPVILLTDTVVYLIVFKSIYNKTLIISGK